MSDERKTALAFSDNELVWLWNVTQVYRPANGLETDLVSGLRAKVKDLVGAIQTDRKLDPDMAQELAEAHSG